MYSKIGDLKIIKLKKDNLPHPSGLILPYNFVGVVNHKITKGLILSSKINRLRKDGMYLKYFKNHYTCSNLRSLPLPLEYKLYGYQLIAKKYIKS